ncbi:MAG: GNAT family N-acetyltransferase [Bacteroidota bacterium]
MNAHEVSIQEARTPKAYEMGKVLFEEYARELQVDLSFQNFEEEMERIQEQYGKPSGCLYIVFGEKEEPVGCFGIRKWDGKVCELKRMYIHTRYRGYGLGKRLLKKSIVVGRQLGYQTMRLDTLPTMNSAISLYKSVGFYEIDPYRYNPIEGTKYFERQLTEP